MFIKKIEIENYRIFHNKFTLKFDVPDSATNQLGVTIICGENGFGGTTLLDAIALAIQFDDVRKIDIEDFNVLTKKISVKLYTSPFQVSRLTDPKIKFQGEGFNVGAHYRKKSKNDSILFDPIIKERQTIIVQDPCSEVEQCDLLCCNQILCNDANGRYASMNLLYLDKDRILQLQNDNIQRGIWDNCLEKLNYIERTAGGVKGAYVKNISNSMTYLNKSFEYFEKICGFDISLYSNHPYYPMQQACIAMKSQKPIRLERLGTGYAMFFNILCIINIAVEIKKEPVILIDEPELHLAPKLQSALIDIIIEYATKVQFIIVTHSPIFVQRFTDKRVKIHMLKRCTGGVSKQGRRILNKSVHEINYLIFDLAAEEYFNELYEAAERFYCSNTGTDDLLGFDRHLSEKIGIKQDCLGHVSRKSKPITYIKYIRNIIHHKAMFNDHEISYSHERLKNAIDDLRLYLKK